jgi:hypothetical protein
VQREQVMLPLKVFESRNGRVGDLVDGFNGPVDNSVSCVLASARCRPGI